MKVAVSGGPPVLLAARADVRGASWHLETGIVFSVGASRGLSTVTADGGPVEDLSSLNQVREEDSHRFANVLPGGRDVLFSIGTPHIESWDDAPIAALSLTTGEHAVLLVGGSYPQYSPSGHIVYGRDGALFAVPFDLAGRRLTGTPTRVLNGVVTNPLHGHAQFSLSRDGSLLVRTRECADRRASLAMGGPRRPPGPTSHGNASRFPGRTCLARWTFRSPRYRRSQPQPLGV